MTKVETKPCSPPWSRPVKCRDKGWAWVVLIASFCTQLLCDGTVSAYGVVYAGFANDTYFKKANYTEEKLALPGAIQSCLYVTAMGLASLLINLLGFQWVACVGGLLAGLSMLAATLFTDIYGMVFFYGALSGLGLGSTFICAVVAVTYYFDRYRGVASGLASAGTGVGYIVVPLVLYSLIAQFDTPVGWRYAILVYSLILTGTTFVNGLVFRPLEIEVATLKGIIDIENMHTCFNSHLDEASRAGLETIRESEVLQYTSQPKTPLHLPQAKSAEIFASVPTIPGSQLEESLHVEHSEMRDAIVAKERDAAEQMLAEKIRLRALNNCQREGDILKSTPDGLSHLQLWPSYLHMKGPFAVTTAIAKPFTRPDSLFLSSLHILPSLDRSISNLRMDLSTRFQLLERQAAFADGSTILSTVSLAGTSVKCNFQRTLTSLRLRLVRMFGFGLFTNFSYLVLCTSFLVCQLAYFVPFVYLFTYALKAGLARNSAMWLITTLGILHTLGRLVGGAIANFHQVDIVIVTAVSCLLCAVCHFALPFLPHTLIALAIYSGSFGFLCAVPCPLQCLLFVRFLGLSRLAMAIGNSSIIKGIAAAVGPIVAAYIKDSTGSLDGAFYWCGSCLVVSGLLLFLLYLPCEGEK
ncbi:Monocarboxylate transporter 7 [Taenia crassiceps]|uniref:Monocarboxylate transporter 7 n=1 Tax=Taenia crassiceps TaxID=6207 RepID=A0ABR4QPL7_9CEST